jgi:hypothetical protein
LPRSVLPERGFFVRLSWIPVRKCGLLLASRATAAR